MGKSGFGQHVRHRRQYTISRYIERIAERVLPIRYSIWQGFWNGVAWSRVEWHRYSRLWERCNGFGTAQLLFEKNRKEGIDELPSEYMLFLCRGGCVMKIKKSINWTQTDWNTVAGKSMLALQKVVCKSFQLVFIPNQFSCCHNMYSPFVWYFFQYTAKERWFVTFI